MNATTPIPWPKPSEEVNARASFGAIFEHAPIAAARCDSRGFILEINPAFKRSLGDPQGWRLCELASELDREEMNSALHEVFSSQRSGIAVETAAADDPESTIKWTLWQQQNAWGTRDQVIVVADKIRTPDAADENQLQSQRWQAIGRLAGGIVHDFNNLLTGVLLYCDLLLTSLDGRDRRRRYGNEIRSAIVQASGLIGQLLVFARPKSLSARPLSLNETVESMRDLIARLIGENIKLDLHLDPDLGQVNIDPAQAQQVLLNLVLNARDALPKGGRITVQTHNCQFQPITAIPKPVPFPCVLLTVGDNGKGMNAETRQRLFEPFFTTKNAGEGTGLGLTTVRSIVTSHRGLIHFESEPEQGTRVLVLFPRASPEPTAIVLSSSPVSQTSTAEHTKESQL